MKSFLACEYLTPFYTISSSFLFLLLCYTHLPQEVFPPQIPSLLLTHILDVVGFDYHEI